jgi:hypothetical protein
MNAPDGVPADDNPKAQTLGCNAAKSGESGVVVLDFAGQVTQNGVNGTYTWSSHFLSDTDVESVAEGYAQGFANCASSSQFVWLGVGTNSSETVTQALGQDWAGVVTTVNAWVQSTPGVSFYVAVSGANDIETAASWAGPSSALPWGTGYASAADGGVYFDYGSAACNETLHPGPGVNTNCNGGWTQSQVWQTSWGNEAAVPLPEIYNVNDLNALQWEQIGLYGYYTAMPPALLPPSVPTFEGSVTELEACEQKQDQNDKTCYQNSSTPTTIVTNSPSDGWSQLYEDLTCTNSSQYEPPACVVEQSSLPYSTDFSWN